MQEMFQKQVESILGQKVTHTELALAVEATKDDAFANCILYGKDVTHQYFVTKACEYITCLRRAAG